MIHATIRLDSKSRGSGSIRDDLLGGVRSVRKRMQLGGRRAGRRTGMGVAATSVRPEPAGPAAPGLQAPSLRLSL